MTIKSEWALVRFDKDSATGETTIGPSSDVTPEFAATMTKTVDLLLQGFNLIRFEALSPTTLGPRV